MCKHQYRATKTIFILTTTLETFVEFLGHQGDVYSILLCCFRK